MTKQTKQRTDINKSLAGREVYFKLTKKQLESWDDREFIVPGKFYTITSHKPNDSIARIEADDGDTIIIMLAPNTCAFLNEIKGWSLKRAPKQQKQ